MMIAVLGRYSDAVALLREALGDDGWIVRSFADDQALDAAQLRNLPEVLLVDLASYDGDEGWALLGRLRECSSWASVPVIACADHVWEVQSHLERLDDGVAAVLVQPCSREDVLRCLEAAQAWTPERPDTHLITVSSSGAVTTRAV